jgi:peptide/nickel transport system substrate-binding protein
MHKRLLATVGALVLLIGSVGLLALVTGALPGAPPPPASPEPTATPAPAAVATAPREPSAMPAEQSITTPAAEPATIVVCLVSEPKDLSPLGGTALVKSHLFEALYETLVDTRDYGFQPNAVVKLPSFADGDARLIEVDVRAGDRVYDSATDQVVILPLTRTLVLAQASGPPLVLPAGATSARTVQVEASWTLVPDLTWEDGVPVTARDFAFTWQLARESRSPLMRRVVELSVAFEATGERTLRWTGVPGYFTPGYVVPPLQVAVPEHVYASRVRPDRPRWFEDDEQLNRRPLAYGPFRLVSWTAGRSFELAANPYYWRADEGLPKVERLVSRLVAGSDAPSSARNLLELLASGTCDLGTQDTPWGAQLADLRALEAAGDVRVQQVPGLTLEHLDFNARPAEDYTGFAGAVRNADGSPIFANPEIRQAIAYCIDRDELVSDPSIAASLPDGPAAVQHSYVPADHPLYAGDAGLVRYDFDPARGLALLAKNGWTDSDGDGVLDRDGTGFSFVYSARTSPLRERVAPIVQTQLKTNCMIEATVELHGGEYFADGPAGMVFGRRYDVAEFSWLTGVEPPCDLYVTRRIPNAENGWGASNNTGFSDAAFDAACDAALFSADPQARAAAHLEAQRIWSEALPSLPLFARTRMVVTRPELAGLRLDATSASELVDVEYLQVLP